MRSSLFASFEHRLGATARKFATAPLPLRLSIATALVGMAAAARALLARDLASASPDTTFRLAVEISALLGGLAPGLFATAASAGAARLWFTPPGADAGLSLFVASGAFFSLLAGVVRRAWLTTPDARFQRSGYASRVERPIVARANDSRDRLDTVGGMAAALAHDVNQPLAATVTYLKVARRLLEKTPVATPEIFQVLEKATAQTLRAGRIVTSLRDLVRRREPDKTLVKLNELVGEAFDLSDVSAGSAEFALRLERGAKRDCVLADRTQIQLVIANLVRNALDAMRASEKRQLVISTSNPDNHSIRVDVIDTGCGLPDSWEDGAFEPFTTTKANGMGVGLSISRSIIEQHDGRIWAAPNRDGGTVFSFILPLEDLEFDA